MTMTPERLAEWKNLIYGPEPINADWNHVLFNMAAIELFVEVERLQAENAVLVAIISDAQRQVAEIVYEDGVMTEKSFQSPINEQLVQLAATLKGTP